MNIRGHRLKYLALAVFLYSVFPIAWLIKPYILKINVTTCTFKILTGKDCPFCGLTRALAFAMHGEFDKAFSFHPLWWLAATMIALTGFIFLYKTFNDGDRAGKKRNLWEWLVYAVIALFAVIKILF